MNIPVWHIVTRIPDSVETVEDSELFALVYAAHVSTKPDADDVWVVYKSSLPYVDEDGDRVMAIYLITVETAMALSLISAMAELVSEGEE